VNCYISILGRIKFILGLLKQLRDDGMKFKEWFSVRSPIYIRQRAKNLLTRYELSPSKAMRRIDSCINVLMDNGCAPTFFTPGIVLKRFPQFFGRLQEAGAEIAVHGYQHVDFSAYPINFGYKQLVRAVEAYNRNGIDVHGVRFPYLGYTDEILDTIPKGLFQYSSNKAIYWNYLQDIDDDYVNIVRDTLRKLYQGAPSTDAISVPYTRPNMLEIPVCLPDDMELIDGLNFSADDVTNVWSHILDCTHQRGELFSVIFHPELATLCEKPLNDVLRYAKLKRPYIWITRLCDISDWWTEKAGFRVEITPSVTGLHLNFVCSSRATILVKGFDLRESGTAWDGSYQRLQAKILEMPASPRPFLGLSAKVSQKVISFLREQGYILDTTETAPSCGVYLDEAILAGLNSEIALINYIEACSSPLVRYWRWPNGTKSVLSITGDLDALSLFDYLSRLYKT
jgi:hypothetical protein